MDGWIKQSTAHAFQMGPFVDSTDGMTPETGLTIAAASVLISKHGAALAAKNDATALTGTGDSHGYYDCVLNDTDTGTLGTLKVEAQIAGALPVWHTFQVVPAQVWDSLFGADKLDVAVVEQANIDFGALQKTSLNAATPASVQNIAANGSGLTALGDTRIANLDAAISTRLAPSGTVAACTLVNGLAANVITAASLNADAGTEIAAAVWAKTGAVLSLSLELVLERLYEMVNNKMIVTEATGGVALRNLADDADVATGNVQDLGATTVRTGLTWV